MASGVCVLPMVGYDARLDEELSKTGKLRV